MLERYVAQVRLLLSRCRAGSGLIGLPEAADLPAVRWKVVNLEKLKKTRPEIAAQRDALRNLLQ